MRVAGTMLLAPAGEALGLGELDEHQDVDTVGGLVLKLLGRQPKVGDEVDVDGYHVQVEGAQGFRITSLLFTRRPEPEREREEEEPSPVAHG
jgi:CBS domain containing-hemolysin-like protein